MEVTLPQPFVVVDGVRVPLETRAELDSTVCNKPGCNCGGEAVTELVLGCAPCGDKGQKMGMPSIPPTYVVWHKKEGVVVIMCYVCKRPVSAIRPAGD